VVGTPTYLPGDDGAALGNPDVEELLRILDAAAPLHDDE
jgi:hypothetical protein